jgi:hypothetical protein
MPIDEESPSILEATRSLKMTIEHADETWMDEPWIQEELDRNHKRRAKMELAEFLMHRRITLWNGKEVHRPDICAILVIRNLDVIRDDLLAWLRAGMNQ